MPVKFRMTALSCGVAILAACQTTPTSNYLPAEARPLIKEIDSVMIAKQTAVGADIKTSKISKYVQGHIIPVLIDVGLNTVRTAKAMNYVAPLHETLDGYDYAADIREEFNFALADSGLEGADDLKILRQEPQGFRTALIRQSRADAVMFIDVKYAFTPKFDNLNLTSSVLLYPINPQLSPYKEKPDTDLVIEYSDNIYRNSFMASIPVPDDWDSDDELDLVFADEGEKDRVRKTSENAARWAEMSEEELTGKLQKAARVLASHIAADMKLDEALEDAETDVEAAGELQAAAPEMPDTEMPGKGNLNSGTDSLSN